MAYQSSDEAYRSDQAYLWFAATGVTAIVVALALTGAALLMTAVVVALQRILSTIQGRGRSMAATLPALLTPRSE